MVTVAGVGDLTVDVLLTGLERRPDWGHEVEVTGMERRLGGNLGNLAVGAAALGTDLLCCGPVGRDPEADFIRAALAALGMSDRLVHGVADAGTSQTFAAVRADGERFFITYGGALGCLEQMLAEVALPEAEAVFLTGWCQPPRVRAELLLSLLDRWRRDGRQVVMDLSWSDSSWERRRELLPVLGRMHWVLLNRDELRALTGQDGDEQGLAALQAALGGPRGSGPGIVLKCGADGARLVQGTDSWHTPALSIRPRETVGAGDMFNAAFLHAIYTRRTSPAAALRFSAAFAGLTLARGRHDLPGEADVNTILDQVEG